MTGTDDTDEHGRAFEACVSALRTLQDEAAGVRMPATASRAATDLLQQAASLLRPHLVPEKEQYSGRLMGYPGRGQSLVPPIEFRQRDEGRASGAFTYRRFHLGGGGAAHGGTVPLVFDDFMGRTIGSLGPPRYRTAFLNVDFRSIARIGERVVIQAWLERDEGRKRFVRADMQQGDRLVAEAHALFVRLRPGQP